MAWCASGSRRRVANRCGCVAIRSACLPWPSARTASVWPGLAAMAAFTCGTTTAATRRTCGRAGLRPNGSPSARGAARWRRPASWPTRPANYCCMRWTATSRRSSWPRPRRRHGLACGVDGRLVVTAGADNVVRLYVLDDAGRAGPPIEFPGHSRTVTAVAIDPGGRYIASASDDETIRLWNIAERKIERILKGHNHVVLSVAFSPNGAQLVSGSVDKTKAASGTWRPGNTSSWRAHRFGKSGGVSSERASGGVGRRGPDHSRLGPGERQGVQVGRLGRGDRGVGVSPAGTAVGQRGRGSGGAFMGFGGQSGDSGVDGLDRAANLCGVQSGGTLPGVSGFAHRGARLGGAGGAGPAVA